MTPYHLGRLEAQRIFIKTAISRVLPGSWPLNNHGIPQVPAARLMPAPAAAPLKPMQELRHPAAVAAHSDPELMQLSNLVANGISSGRHVFASEK